MFVIVVVAVVIVVVAVVFVEVQVPTSYLEVLEIHQELFVDKTCLFKTKGRK
jgi:hypothetical protein